ncbi:ABC transporter permease [Salipiger mucosus]|uniref:ABC transporter, membrane spanning protein n=1 Tax=Salipiger mucosus DSM 16094 TaxID=1123237 RepID=S9QLY5_9RHOB|nr:ABC transporter permease [Salipiger mucosus]EPX82476.1 ABC transporter, membrane spanning protein [Salipiger mucosus DSM 16094]
MNPVVKIILQRLALGLLTLFIVSIVIFTAVNMLPGDFAQAILGQGASPEAVEAIRRDLGLDQPPVTRYLQWLGDALRGDLGNSFAQANFSSFVGEGSGGARVTVAQQIAPRFANTMFLAGVTAAIAVPFAVTLGVLAALYRNSAFDKAANVATLTSISSPEFFLAYVLILFLAVLNPVLPSLSNIYADMGFGERLVKTLLPALTLTLVVTAHMMRMTRAAIINLLASPYIEMARLKGIGPMRVIVKHALPNALAPIINVIALNLAYLITGVVVVEVVFVYPGIGQLFVDSVKIRDIPVVQACCLIFAAAYILLNLTADILSIATNPRLRQPK